MPTFGGVLEIIGVRAVFQDLGRFQSSAKSYETAVRKMTEVEKVSEQQAKRTQVQERKLFEQRERMLLTEQKRAATTREGRRAATQEIEIFNEKKKILSIEDQIQTAKARQEATNRRNLRIEEQRLEAQRQHLVTATRTGAILATAGAIGVGIASINQAAKFETAITKINTLTQATDEQVAELSVKLLEMGDNLPVPQIELANAAYFALSSGIKSVDEALAITADSAKLSAIGLGEVSDIAKFLTSTIVAYGEANLSAAEASDLLISAVQLGQGEASDFAQSLGRVIPVAANMGVELDEVLAVVAALTTGGLEATQATTGLLGIFNQLLSPSKAAEETLAQLGLTIGDVVQSLRDNGFIETLTILADKLQDNPLLARTIFDETRGLNAFLSAFANNGQKTIDILTTMRKQGGELNKQYEIASKTFANQAQILKNRLNRALIEIGSAVLPAVNEQLKQLIIWIQQNRKSIVDFAVIGIGTALKLLKGFLEGMKLIITVLGWIPGHRAQIVAAIVAIGTALAWALPGGPILKGLLAIVTAIGIIAGGASAPGLTKGQSLASALIPVTTGVGGAVLGSLFGPAGTIAGGTLGTGLGSILTGALIKPKGGDGASDAFDASEQFEIQLKKLESQLDLTGLSTDDLTGATDGSGSAADKAAEKLKDLAKSFEDSGKAAAEVESFTSKMKLFGEISKEVADAFGLSAIDAGAVQALDAVIREQERATKGSFEYAKAIATVANAYSQSVNIARRIVLNLARTGIENTRSAASAIFGSSSREVANLSLQVAERKPGALVLNQNLKPQIEQLKKQLDDVQETFKDFQDNLEDQIDAIEKASAKQIDSISDTIDNIKESADDRIDQLNNSLDDIRDKEDEYLELLDHRIDQEEDRLDQLQDIYKNEIDIIENNIDALKDLLDQSMSAQDRAGIESNIRALENERATRFIELAQRRDTIRELKKERDTYEEVTDAQIRAIEEQIEVIQEATDAQVEALEKQKEAIQDSTAAQVEAIENQIDAAKKREEAQEKAIQNQITSLEDIIEKYDEVTQKIQDQIDVFEANKDILQKQFDAADQTRLSEEEQRVSILELIGIYKQETQIARDLSTALGESLIPEVNIARESFKLLTDTVNVLNDPVLRTNFLTAINEAAARNNLLAAAAYEAESGSGSGGGLLGLAKAANDAAEKIRIESDAFATAFNDIDKAFFDKFGTTTPAGNIDTNPFGQPPAFVLPRENVVDPAWQGFAEGGIVRRPTFAKIGEDGIEAILPLSNARRSREIIASLPPGVAAGISGAAGGGGVSVQTGDVTIMDPKKTTGSIGDMAWSIQRALRSRGAL